jgi:hypothetical protein
MKQQQTKLLIPVMEFAFRKLVYATSVYSAIEQGKIKPDYVGSQRIVMIDIKKYGNYKFRVHNPDKAALIRWYVSVGHKIKGEKVKRKLMGRYGLQRHELVKQEPQKKEKYAEAKTANTFTEWCFNRFVDGYRGDAPDRIAIYYEVLQMHYQHNLKGFGKQRSKAKELLQKISDVLKTLPDNLNYKGTEGREELALILQNHEADLIAMGLSAKEIKRQINIKRKQYGR